MEQKKIWHITDYQEYLQLLKSKENVQYRDFHSRLTTTKYPILGISVPECRKIAKEILKKVDKNDVEKLFVFKASNKELEDKILNNIIF